MAPKVQKGYSPVNPTYVSRSLHKDTGGRFFDVIRMDADWLITVWMGDGNFMSFRVTDPAMLQRIKAQAIYHGQGLWQFLRPQQWRERMHSCTVLQRPSMDPKYGQRVSLNMEQIYKVRATGLIVKVAG